MWCTCFSCAFNSSDAFHRCTIYTYMHHTHIHAPCTHAYTACTTKYIHECIDAPHTHICMTNQQCIYVHHIHIHAPPNTHVCIDELYTHICTICTYMHHMQNQKCVGIDIHTCTTCTHVHHMHHQLQVHIHIHASPNTHVSIDAPFTYTCTTFVLHVYHMHQ